MLSGTRIKPPQFDEFFPTAEGPLRASEFTDLGWTEEPFGGGPTLSSPVGQKVDLTTLDCAVRSSLDSRAGIRSTGHTLYEHDRRASLAGQAKRVLRSQHLIKRTPWARTRLALGDAQTKDESRLPSWCIGEPGNCRREIVGPTKHHVAVNALDGLIKRLSGQSLSGRR